MLIFDLILEPYFGDTPAVFENKAKLNQTFTRRSEWDKLFDIFVERMCKSTEEVLDEFFDNMKPIIGAKITLTDVYIHEVDSREMSFKIATYIAMNEVLPDENLIRINN